MLGRALAVLALAAALAAADASAAITVGASTSASSTTATLTITRPTTTTGTVLVATISGAGTGAFTAPAGWTLVQDTTSGSLREVSYVHVVGASEPTTYAFTSAAARAASGGMTAYSGANTVVPVDASAESTGTSGSAVSPSVTTTSANALVITAVATATNSTWTPASGTTERYDKASGSTSQEAADAAQAAAGASTARTVKPSSTTGVWAAQTIALRDAAAAGLSVSTGTSATFTANLDAGDQIATYTIPITVLDTRTGATAGLGWNLTITSTSLTTGTWSLPAGATDVTGVTPACANGGLCVDVVNGTTYPVAVPAGALAPTAVKFASVAAGSGEGAFSLPAALAVDVGQNSYSGTYTSTITVGIVSGP